MQTTDSFQTKTTLTPAGGATYTIHSLRKLNRQDALDRLPMSLKILLENLLRQEDGVSVRREDIEALLAWDPVAAPDKEISFMPARVILQDFTGVPCAVDLAVMPSAGYLLRYMERGGYVAWGVVPTSGRKRQTCLRCEWVWAADLVGDGLRN